jgi:predicted nucleic acid-binding protein
VGNLVVVDSNVIVAALVTVHEHHAASLALLNTEPPLDLAVSAHSYAETFNTLTRRNQYSPFQWTSAEAWAALESIAGNTLLIGLTPAQNFAAVRDFATAGHIGPRIYDWLIARAAATAGAKVLVTWNIGHFRGLIDGIDVQTPEMMVDD